MLEIFGIMMLCKANKKNALARGKRPGGFIALTIILWVGLELVGFFVGALTEIEYGSILFGYGFAGLGALISFLLAKFGPKGNYVDPKADPSASASVDANAPMVGAYNVPVDSSSYAPYQNAPAGGVPVDQYGMPVNNTQMNEYGMPVDSQGNYAPVLNQYGVPVDPAPYNAQQPVWNAAPGQAQPAAPAASAAPAQQPKFCANCGSPLNAGSKFCDSCGSKIEA